MKKILNESGMSIINVLIAAAMAGGLALVVAQIGKNSAQIQSGARDASEINSAVASIEKIFLNGKHCHETLRNIGSFSSNSEITFNNIKIIGASTVKNMYTANNGADPVIQASKIKGSQVYISSLKAVRDPGTLDLEIEVAFKKLRKTIGAQETIKRIKVDALYDASGRVSKCYSQMDEAVSTAIDRSCQAVGGNLNTAGKCVLTQATKDEIVKDGLNPIKRPLYLDSSGNVKTTLTYTYTKKTCSKCSKSGCTPSPCPAGYTDLGGKCSKGGLCGLKPRWRNCHRDCRKANSPVGHYIKN